jgi:hypothetical protein
VVTLSLVLKDSSGSELARYERAVFLDAWRMEGAASAPRATTPVTFDFRPKVALWIEAEKAQSVPGLEIDMRKPGTASDQLGLGVHSDEQQGIVCTWSFRLSEQLAEPELLVRHAHEKAAGFELKLDGRTRGSIHLPATGGWGYEPHEWQWAAVELGEPLAPGEHTLSLVCADQTPVNLDCLALSPAGRVRPEGVRVLGLGRDAPD